MAQSPVSYCTLSDCGSWVGITDTKRTPMKWALGISAITSHGNTQRHLSIGRCTPTGNTTQKRVNQEAKELRRTRTPSGMLPWTNTVLDHLLHLRRCRHNGVCDIGTQYRRIRASSMRIVLRTLVEEEVQQFLDNIMLEEIQFLCQTENVEP